MKARSCQVVNRSLVTLRYRSFCSPFNWSRMYSAVRTKATIETTDAIAVTASHTMALISIPMMPRNPLGEVVHFPQTITTAVVGGKVKREWGRRPHGRPAVEGIKDEWSSIHHEPLADRIAQGARDVVLELPDLLQSRGSLGFPVHPAAVRPVSGFRPVPTPCGGGDARAPALAGNDPGPGRHRGVGRGAGNGGSAP